jgi:phage tail P2-like protein
MRDLYTMMLEELLPHSLLSDENVISAAKALDGEVQDVSSSILETLILPRIDELSEEIVDLLAWQFHVDFYDPALSLTAKRNLVKSSILVHRRKGTPWAVRQVCNDAFGYAEIIEWFDYGGEPYHFSILTEGRLVDSAAWQSFFRALESAKNVRSWLDEITISRPLHLDLHYGMPQLAKGMTSLTTHLPNNTVIKQHYGTATGKLGSIRLATLR